MTSRIHRGFHRLGVVLAVPVALVAVGLAGREVWTQWEAQYFWAADPIVGHPAPTFLERFDTSAYHANLATSALLLVLAPALYIAARVVGWVLDGFIGPTSEA